ncbi:probable ATP-dependent DNA helicase HFM1 [Diadema antillarum]|uniref:probable ATP-dependent DNA helicase HFM1 n=1 Tax=Diadema antillarum TaxID=105358 RepID=UPI003A8B41E8
MQRIPPSQSLNLDKSQEILQPDGVPGSQSAAQSTSQRQMHLDHQHFDIPIQPPSHLQTEKYRGIFPFPYFNFVQSQFLDDILYTDKPLVISAPTGSGKTVLFELAILRLLVSQGGYDNRTKVVYMAPIKVLCSQRCIEWKEKFEPLGLICQELTGDSDIDDFYQLQAVNIIFTTPEKWDSMTRRWRDNQSLVQLVKLFLVDEVHSLNEETRGATVEAVISRMKTVRAAQPEHETNSSHATEESRAARLRFVAVSATIPNIRDIAEWLGSAGQAAIFHRFDDSHRPVKLRKVVLGYPCSENFSDFKFDLSLNYKLSGVIQTYSENKPTLVFCATRKAVEQAAAILVKEARFIMNSIYRQRLQIYNNRIRDSKLRDLVMNGVGFHHAGLDIQDRKAVEEMFLQGDLPVLMSTSTLAMGVNLPAHLVVVKSTQHYAAGMYREYSETQILQMIGRAGRPQFDTTATAVIMTKQKTKFKYENLLNGTEEIESSLHNHLVEHLNAEIVLHTIDKMKIALEWLKSTFLYIRLQKNPTHYGLPVGLTQTQLEQKLQEMCTKDLKSLASIDLISMDMGSGVLKPLETGRLMARYCVAFETMKQFTKIAGTENLSDMIVLLSQCKEFADIQLRVNERKVLNKMNKDKNHITIRFPMNGKIKTTDMKVNCLLQATLGSIPIQEFALNQDCFKIFRACQRLTRCLTEYLMTRTEFQSLLSAVIAAKCTQARLWESSKHVARQLDKIGPAMSTALVNAGLVSFQALEKKNPREIELILNRHPPFGNQIVEAIQHLPKYDVSIEQTPRYSPMRAELSITVSLLNWEQLSEKQTTKRNHSCLLLLGDADNKVVYKQRIMDNQLLQSGVWTRRVEVKRALKGEDISINLVSQDYVGLDVQNVYTPFYSGPKHLRADTEASVPNSETKPALLKLVPSSSSRRICSKPQMPALSNENTDPGCYGERKPCCHRCLDKDTCGHSCCKFGIPVKPAPKSRASATKRPPLGECTSHSEAPVPATPQRPKVQRGLDGFLSQLHHRAQAMNVTPDVKRLKFSDSTLMAPLPGLDRFAYKPSQNVLPPLKNGNMPATPCPTRTPDLTPSQKTPVASGWEHLDFYCDQKGRRTPDKKPEWNDRDENEELPDVSLSFDATGEDLPCFDLGAEDDVICLEDQDEYFHPPTPSGYLWKDMATTADHPLSHLSSQQNRSSSSYFQMNHCDLANYTSGDGLPSKISCHQSAERRRNPSSDQFVPPLDCLSQDHTCEAIMTGPCPLSSTKHTFASSLEESSRRRAIQEDQYVPLPSIPRRFAQNATSAVTGRAQRPPLQNAGFYRQETFSCPLHLERPPLDSMWTRPLARLSLNKPHPGSR